MFDKRIAPLIVVLALLLLGCGFNFSFGDDPTATPAPPTPVEVPATDVPASPTDTPAPPASTDTPEPAATAAPTDPPAAEPTSTPEATASGASTPLGAAGGIKRSTHEDSEPTFDFVSHTAWVDDYGDISIVGEVVNVSDVTVDTVVAIEAVLYDEDGDQIEGDFGAYLDRPVIAPGEKSSFWVLIFGDDLGEVDPDAVVDYELTLWVTGDPSVEVELLVNEAEAFEEAGTFYIRGELENQTDLSFASLVVYSTLYDADGNVVNATLDFVSPDGLLEPGDTMMFEGYFPDHFEDADSFYVFATGYPEDSDEVQKDAGGLVPGEGIVEVTSHTGWVTDSGDVHIVGEAVNVSDQTLDTLILVEALLFDADGNQIEGDFSYYLDRPVIVPGEKSSFWIPIYASELEGVDVDAISDYEILLWVTDEPSPDVEIVVTEADSTVEDDLFYIRGTVQNQTGLEFVALAVYSTLYDADGAVVNATLDWIDLDVPLAPGDETEFEGYFLDHFDEADSFYVVVTGYTAEQLGG